MINLNKTMWMAKKMLPEYVFDTAQLEGNPMTFPEIQTLMDGITVGGHKISDAQQVLNLKEAWQKAFDYADKSTIVINKALYLDIHNSVGKEEAMEWGKFRNGSVGIAGTTSYTAPDATNLDTIFNEQLSSILAITDITERAIRLFLWGVYNQFFWDGNKRTSRIIANILLMHYDIGIFNIKAKDIMEFNTLMVDFYNTKETTKIYDFLKQKCIVKTDIIKLKG